MLAMAKHQQKITVKVHEEREIRSRFLTFYLNEDKLYNHGNEMKGKALHGLQALEVNYFLQDRARGTWNKDRKCSTL